MKRFINSFAKINVMRSRIGIIIIVLFYWIAGAAQNEGDVKIDSLFKENKELYLIIYSEGKNQTVELSKLVSIDNVYGKTVVAYANRAEFEEFLRYDYFYVLSQHPGKSYNPEMKSEVDLKGLKDWDFYPTYEAFISMMQQFEANYPSICKVFSIGQSIEGREIMFARISDNAGQEEGEPQFMYTATMHGDETAGYVLTLRLIDYLLTEYGTNARITEMVNDIDIWINPLANPDGTYAGGNNSVYGATRYNANGVDLNRNYPDPEDGPHPDGNPWQQETILFMELAENNHFDVSSNLHGGTEVCNYPWDTWATLHADNDWWYYVCREYADTVHAHAPTGYMDDYDNGITNGYAWYTISGGRQDYMNYFHQCREFTLEISDTKLLPENQLEAHWEYNYRSFLNYIEQSMFGIHGIVTDSITGNPVEAEIFIPGHDIDSSMVFSNLPHGDYHRPVHEGTYNLIVSAVGYYPKEIQNVQAQNRQTNTIDIELVAADLIADFYANVTTITAGEPVQFTDISTNDPTAWYWTFEGGTPMSSNDQNPVVNYITAGVYDVKLLVTNQFGADSVLVEDYITVNEIINVEEFNEYEISIFPNPADDRISLASDFEISSISIISNCGEIVLLEENRGDLYNLQTNNLMPGFYLIKITLGDKVVYRKILIKH
ncbi:MAG: T9SS type A sorting domain-containing protein [Bacteroidales bacterium]|nr:T9SS type A sorting domain-containing protein [Bacteroidales bacterium]